MLFIGIVFIIIFTFPNFSNSERYNRKIYQNGSIINEPDITPLNQLKFNEIIMETPNKKKF